MITFRQKGDFSRFNRYIERLRNVVKMGQLDKFGKAGVTALANATPKDSGKTAESWYYEIVRKNNQVAIQFKNSNINEGVPIAVILQVGHGTRNGGWVEGRDYINPAIGPIFDQIANDAWEEVRKIK